MTICPLFLAQCALWLRPPLVCVSFHWKTIFIGSLHAAYSALRHFFTCSPIWEAVWKEYFLRFWYKNMCYVMPTFIGQNRINLQYFYKIHLPSMVSDIVASSHFGADLCTKRCKHKTTLSFRLVHMAFAERPENLYEQWLMSCEFWVQILWRKLL